MPINIQQNQKLFLPRLTKGPFKYEVGEVWNLIRDEQEVEVIAISEIPISPKISEQILELDNNEKIIFTERKKIILPSEADGALRVLENGSYE